MEPAAAFLAAATLILLLLVIAAYAWWQQGWTEFSYVTGNTVKWDAKGSHAGRLRFKDCVFTVSRLDGVQATSRVNAALNAMASAYSSGGPGVLELTRPLNAFSFTIKGFNDPDSVKDPGGMPWCKAQPKTCKGDGDCGTDKLPSNKCWQQKCVLCDEGAVVTLTGKFRVI